MVEKSLTEEYKKLNAKQREAVDAIEGPVMVIAGPGTGKTSVLTLRIANILKKTDTTPDSLLALTFTDSGVRAMRRKLVELVGEATYRVHIHTFHSFCNEIIRRFPQEFPRIIGSVHMTDLDAIRIMESIFDETSFERLKPPMNPYFYLKPALSHIQELKRENIDPKEFERVVLSEKKEFEKIPDLYYESGKWQGEMRGMYKAREKKILNNLELLTIYRLYEKALEKERLYDYEDMVMEVVKVLEKNRDLLLRVGEEYQYILADEHQDANNAQNRLLELVSSFHENPNLFIVGDEKQAIFRFQGASLENFLYFTKKFPKAKVIRLEENYRSTQLILDAAHTLISKNTSGKGEHVLLRSPLKKKGLSIGLGEFPSRDLEYHFLIEDIRKKIKAGVPQGEIAVLYRHNKDAEELKNFFDASLIETTLHSDSDLFQDEDMFKLLLLLRSAENPSAEETLAQVLYIDFLGLNHMDVHRLIHYSSKNRIPLSLLLRQISMLEKVNVEEPKIFLHVATRIHELSVIAKNKSLLVAFEAIATRSGFLEHVISSPHSVEKLSLYEVLLQKVKMCAERQKNARLSDFLLFLSALETHDMRTTAKASLKEGRVNLMTAHKSKGLEFSYVYIIHANDRSWGSLRAHPSFFTIPGMNPLDDSHVLDDERRLFYVALTRAKDEVIVTRFLFDNEGKETVPSIFLSEIDPMYTRKIDTRHFSQEALLLKNKVSIRKKEKANTPSSGLKDKVYLQGLFLEEGLSVTALNNYLRCPWQYFFINLIRIPKAEEKPQLYGTAIHETLKEFFDAYKEGEDITKAEALRRFTLHLKKKHLSTNDIETLTKKGTQALSGYLDFYKRKWSREIFNEFRVGGIFLPVNSGKKKFSLLLKGNLDKVEVLSGGSVNVVDYKTGRPKTRNEILGRTQSSEGEYGRQLVFYKLLLDRFQNGKFKMISGEIDFVEPDEKGKYRKEKFEITDAEVQALETVLKKVANEMYTLSFWDRHCDDKDCEYCRLSKFLQ